jgi:hypothetical protein
MSLFMALLGHATLANVRFAGEAGRHRRPLLTVSLRDGNGRSELPDAEVIVAALAKEHGFGDYTEQ